MNLSGNPAHREMYVLSAEPAEPAPGTVSTAGARGRRTGGRAAGRVLGTTSNSSVMGHGVAVQAPISIRCVPTTSCAATPTACGPPARRRAPAGLGGRRPEPRRPLRPGGRLPPTVISASGGSQDLAIALQARKLSLISIDPGGATPARRGPQEPQRGANVLRSRANSSDPSRVLAAGERLAAGPRPPLT